ncbi:hypothetical protein EJ04DRAFT_559013 [Polyplosphaeria fusca]|uniref:Uncharacterized protein n=1 Tax=Polyplosphaeria fusca TaxID=682080 RepID=A0A9P4V745_9PLEO|nr:hypothetical protein EJ04DRAFT_559013 [Polyplosphaeria fusca]
MANEQNGSNGANGGAHQEPDFAQAFQDLARGERAAAALENHLDKLEKQIEELLAKADEDEKTLQSSSRPSDKPSSNDNEKSA